MSRSMDLDEMVTRECMLAFAAKLDDLVGGIEQATAFKEDLRPEFNAFARAALTFVSKLIKKMQKIRASEQDEH